MKNTNEVVKTYDLQLPNDFTAKIKVYSHYADFEIINNNMNDEIEASGFVKWDGCCNILIGKNNEMKHFCTTEMMQEFFDAVVFLRKSIGKYIPGYDLEIKK